MRDIAHELADVVVASAQAAGEQFAAEMSEGAEPEDRPSPAAVPAEEADAFATASSLARGTPQEDTLRDRAEALQSAAAAAECGPEGWEEPILAADLEAELLRRTTSLESEPSTQEYVAMNLLAAVLAGLDGSWASEAP